MKTVAVVAWREIVEHRVFLAAATAALAMSLIAPIASGLFKASPTDVREIVMVCMALGFVPLVALLLGASTVSGTVAAGRFGFFLSRPVSGAAIWIGKLIGVLVVVLACEAIILAPGVVTPNREGILTQFVSDLPDDYDSPLPRVAAVTGIAMLPLALMLVAHAVASVWRGRSLWLLLDLVTLLAGGTVAWLCLRPLLGNEAEVATAVVVVALGAAAIVALGGAGLSQIAAGGVDPRRQHGAFSVALAVATFVLFASVGGYAAWLTTPSAADLMRNGPITQPSPDGRWLGVQGESASRWDYEAAFLVDLASSKALRIDVAPRSWGRAITFSADGRRAAWLGGSSEPYQVRYCDLEQEPIRCRDTSILVSRIGDIELSSDGNHVALLDDGTLSLSTIPGGDILGVTQVSSGIDVLGPRNSLVAAGQSFRVIGEAWSPSLGTWVARVTEFHIPTRIFARADSPELVRSWLIQQDPVRDRLTLLPWDDRNRTRYVDARTLEDVDWTLARPLGSSVTLLEDGRLVDLVCEHRSCRLEILTPAGELEASRPLPLEDWLRDSRDPYVGFGCEPGPGRLAIRARRCPSAPLADSSGCEWRTVVVDLNDGSVVEIDDNVMRFVERGFWHRVDIPLPAGSPASRLMWGHGGLLLWDPETGESEELATRYE